MIRRLLLVLLALLAPRAVEAAITFNQTVVDATPNTLVNSATITKGFTVQACTDPALLVTSKNRRSGTGVVPITGVTFLGTQSFVVADVGDRTAGPYYRVETWVLVNPTVTTGNVVVNYANAFSDEAMAVEITQLCGVHQTTPIGDHLSANGSGTTASVSITTTTNGAWILTNVIGRDDGGWTAHASQTARVDRIIGTATTNEGSGVSTEEKATAGAESSSWTQASATDWLIQAVEIVPSAGGGPPPPPPSGGSGPQFAGTCNTLFWDANQEVDLAGYRVYDRVSLSATPTKIGPDFGKQITSAACAQFGFNAGQHYLQLRAFDSTGNESAPTADQPFFIITNGAVTDLRITAIGANSYTLAFTEPDCGNGVPCSYDVRYVAGSMQWGSAASVSAGTCTSPLAGTAIGGTKSCTVTGVPSTTYHEFQLVPYRGAPPNAVFNPLSNIVGGTTGGSVPSTTRVILNSDTFIRANGDPGSDWLQGYSLFGAGGCAFTIVSNTVRAATDGCGAAMTFTTTIPPDRQWASVLMSTVVNTTGRFAGLILRGSSGPILNGFNFGPRLASDQCWHIGTVIDNEFGALVTDCSASVLTSGETWLAEADGTTLNLYRVSSGGTETLVLTTTSSLFPSGRAGFLTWTAESDDVRFGLFRVGTFQSTATDTCGCDNH